MKQCTKCKEIKKDIEFYKAKDKKGGLRSACKICTDKLQKIYEENNPEKVKRKRIMCYLRNKDKHKKQTKEWSENNKERHKELQREWYRNNKDQYTKRTTAYQNKKYKSNVKFRLSKSVSSSVYRTLKGRKNSEHWENILGYNIEELQKHLESLFKDGMTWDNYGEWHIDHIIPVSAFNYESYEDIDFKKCWSLNNLQPMWALDNIKKHNMLKEPFQPCFAFH